LATNFWLWRNQMVTTTLMIPLGIIVLQVVRQNIAQRLLTSYSQNIQTRLSTRGYAPAIMPSSTFRLSSAPD
jgi:hypothetical protein